MHPVEQYLAELRAARTAGGVAETSGYYALKQLLDAVGADKAVKPKVRCILHPQNVGAGIADAALFTADQIAKGSDQPKKGQLPACGVIEIKSTSAAIAAIVASEQALGYLARYGQVLVTNYRQFVLMVRDRQGNARKADEFSLGDTDEAFWDLAAHPRSLAEQRGDRLVEFLTRVVRNRVALSEPKDVAWFFASHARDALERVGHRDLPALLTIRTAFEDALGISFSGEKGEHFFRSSLVQTLFYGVFSSWVLWSRSHPPSDTESEFHWREAAWTLRVPMIDALFQQIATPTQLGALGLVPILDRTGEVLNRVDRAAFFSRFQDAEAVQYFYEPFLEAFDPELRKELGVWYTPREVVQYMVARVDTVLREELNIPRGLADPNVYVLDPCCGTGAYLVEVLETVARTLKAEGGDALVASDLRKAARERVFGFEILPAPFVVSHLQLGVLLQRLGAPLRDSDRAAVYLTNALTGWEAPEHGAPIAFPELELERERAGDVKREARILVVLGNPPYNAFAGTSPAEEGDLVAPYKQGLATEWNIRKYNLDELYVRFMRVAERRIAETGRGVVCFVSSYSYVADASFVVMRRHLLSTFDRIWVDSLNGDSRETGKTTPAGLPDPSIFSTPNNRAGIRLGTSIGLFVRSGPSEQCGTVSYRDFWGQNKRAELLQSLSHPAQQYERFQPAATAQYSFRPSHVAVEYRAWPRVTELTAVPPTNGLMEKRGGALIDSDKAALEARMALYLSQDLSWDEYRTRTALLTADAARFDAQKARARVMEAHAAGLDHIIRYAVRPFDTRWAYYSPTRPLWNEPRPTLSSQAWDGNSFVLTRRRRSTASEGVPFSFTTCLCDDHYLAPDAVAIPIQLRERALGDEFHQWSIRDNLSVGSRDYLSDLARSGPNEPVGAMQLWMHILAIAFSPLYLTENSDGIGDDFPRIPLPGGAELLSASAVLGSAVASLLETERSTHGSLDRSMGNLSSTAGSLDPDAGDLAVTSGWGIAGKGGITMPGKGRVIERGDMLDIYLNDRAYWADVPRAVWEYTLGGYQVIKKWLSYREKRLLGRDLTVEEARYVTDMVRRIAAIIALGPALDANYEAVKADAYPWPRSDRPE